MENSNKNLRRVRSVNIFSNTIVQSIIYSALLFIILSIYNFGLGNNLFIVGFSYVFCYQGARLGKKYTRKQIFGGFAGGIAGVVVGVFTFYGFMLVMLNFAK